MKSGWPCKTLCVVLVFLAHVAVFSSFSGVAKKISAGSNALFFEVIGVRVISNVSAKEVAPQKKEETPPVAKKKVVREAKSVQKEAPAKKQETLKEESVSKEKAIERSTAPDLAQGTEPAVSIAARPLYAPRPAYPEEARRLGKEGKLRLALLVDKEGRVKDARVRETSGVDSFDASALRTVKRWRFRAAKDKDGNALERWCVVQIRFELNR